jgi:hypothetical protein
MSSVQRFLIERITVDLVEMHMVLNELSFEASVSVVLSSQVHQKLTDPETGLYLDSAASIYELLARELQDGALIQYEQ